MAPAAKARPKARRRALGFFVVRTMKPPPTVARPAAAVTIKAVRRVVVVISIMGEEYKTKFSHGNTFLCRV